MEELKEKAADLVDHVEDLADTYYKLAVVNITQKATNIASGTVVMVAVCVLGLLIFLFLGIALSWWLGDLLHNRALGFVLGAVVFAFLLLLILWMRSRILFPYIRNLIIRKVYEQDNQDI